MKKLSKNYLTTIFIFFVVLLVRFYGLNWDQGYHLHPDERMISMVVDKIKLPQSSNIGQIFSPDSSLNPKFFAYGSFPIYLLKTVSSIFPSNSPYSQYQANNLLGRGLSAIADSVSVVLIYKIGQLLFTSQVGILASLIYGFAVLPFQLSHFYAVDTLLNCFILFTIYQLCQLYLHRRPLNAILTGIAFGLSLATKISATVLLASIGATFLVEFLLYLVKKNPKPSLTSLQNNTLLLLLVFLVTFTTFFICQPFAFFDFPTFWNQINEQKAMTRNAFVFPYTLQYVFTPPYVYQLKNIFLWGFGPIATIFGLLGFVLSLIKLIKNLFIPGNDTKEGLLLIVFTFCLGYFLVVGSFAIKFVRYCLPLYPFLAIFAAWTIFSAPSIIIKKILLVILMLFQLSWFLAFTHIYSLPNTRVEASNWINQNIPKGSLILREHWDDGLPLFDSRQFRYQDLALYDSDLNPNKWAQIQSQLTQANYLIVASNRLYTPLLKLTNCEVLPPGKCYRQTAQYYQDLFSGKLGYQLVAEFARFPSFLGVDINDQSADESFTVYDHPKIMIFRNTQQSHE